METEFNKTRAHAVVDNIIFILFLAVLVCRLFVNEIFLTSCPLVGESSGGGVVGFGGLSFMLSFDAILLLGSGIWLWLKLKSGNMIWHKTNMVIPVGVLLVGTVVSYIAASDKGVALVSGLNLLSMTVGCVVLVQLLADRTRRKILLAAVIALGICETWRCYEQGAEHEITLEQMEQNYDEFMAGQGIDPASWQARQMEERVRSRDTGGYFSISNTGASYLLLTITAAGCVVAGGGLRKGPVPACMVVGCILLAVMVHGIVMTESTGGKLSLAAMAGGIVAMAVLKNTGKRKLLFGGFIIALVAGVAAVAGYGMMYDRLPTSNLWIRWQYWQGTAKMIADHWLAGVGPFNFDHYYSYYMNPSSPEVVKDPHCVPLAIFSQWGILGLIAMVWAALGVLWLLVKPGEAKAIEQVAEERYSAKKLAGIAGVLALFIFIARMVSVDDSSGAIPAVAKMYLTLEPAIKFGVIFFLLGYLLMCREEVRLDISGRKVLIPLLAGLAGFALHNTIDFAFFQPGVGILFFFMAALAISAKESEAVVVEPKPIYKYTAGVGVLLVVVVLVMPGLGGGIYRTDKAIRKAEKLVGLAGEIRQLGYAEKAIDICLENADACGNDIRSLYYAGRLCNQLWHYSEFKEGKYFNTAVKSYTRASDRDPEHFRYDKLMGELFRQSAKQNKSGSEERKNTNVVAKSYYERYLEKNPGDSDVLVMLAEIKIELGQEDEAVGLAQKALEIEAGCMELQPKLFPHWEEYYPRMDQGLQKRAEEIVKK